MDSLIDVIEDTFIAYNKNEEYEKVTTLEEATCCFAFKNQDEEFFFQVGKKTSGTKCIPLVKVYNTQDLLEFVDCLIINLIRSLHSNETYRNFVPKMLAMVSPCPVNSTPASKSPRLWRSAKAALASSDALSDNV